MHNDIWPIKKTIILHSIQNYNIQEKQFLYKVIISRKTSQTFYQNPFLDPIIHVAISQGIPDTIKFSACTQTI